jgi:hypothetical protein
MLKTVLFLKNRNQLIKVAFLDGVVFRREITYKKLALIYFVF